MYPKQNYSGSIIAGLTLKRQRGFLIPLSIFILVVMSMFAMVLSRNTITASNSSTLEWTTLQTFYAAESGSYSGMAKLFFPMSDVRQQVDSRCNDFRAAAPTTINYTVDGLKSCSAVVTCACVYTDNSACVIGDAANYSPSAPVGRLTSFYTITSVATCGTGNGRAVRTIDTGSLMRQEP